MALIVGLREDGRHCEAAGVRREHRPPRRGSKVRSTGACQWACFKASKLACASGDRTERTFGLPGAVSGTATLAYPSTKRRSLRAP